MHLHVVITNNGVQAKLPATATKEIAVETAVTWLGTRISASGVAELFSHGTTLHTAVGLASLEECDCDEDLLTKEKVKATLAAEIGTRMDAADDASATAGLSLQEKSS